MASGTAQREAVGSSLVIADAPHIFPDPHMDMPLISILIRSMDRSTLVRALRSAVEQTYPHIEIVVVAACGSTHSDIPAQINGRHVRLIRPLSPLDRAAAANAACRAAQGELLNFLDDDDELLPHHAVTLFNALESNPEMDLAFSLTQVVDNNENPAGIFGKPHTHLELFEWSKFHMMAAMFRRRLLEKNVSFDESLPVHEDHDFWIQCAQHTRFCFVENVTNRWHAFIGTSGAGLGCNLNIDKLMQVSAQVQSKWASAKESFENTPEGLLQKARLALKRETPEVALAQAEQTLLVLPNDVNALNFAAMANYYAGNADKAKELINQAIAIMPGHAGLLSNQRLILSGVHVETD